MLEKWRTRIFYLKKGKYAPTPMSDRLPQSKEQKCGDSSLKPRVKKSVKERTKLGTNVYTSQVLSRDRNPC